MVPLFQNGCLLVCHTQYFDSLYWGWLLGPIRQVCVLFDAAFRLIKMNGFTSLWAVFQSCQDDGRVIMKGCVQWNSVSPSMEIEQGATKSAGQAVLNHRSRQKSVFA